MTTSRTHFDVLGVTPRFAVDRAELEEKYLALSRQLHPDKFARATPRERLQAVTRTTELNDAYRVLKDDVKRAEYLLKLEGYDLGEERPAELTGGVDKRVKVDAAVLMDVMERNEELAEARAERDDARVAALAGRVRAAAAEAWGVVERGFADLPSPEDAGAHQAAIAKIAQAMILLRYHARFLEQVEAYEESRADAPAEGRH